MPKRGRGNLLLAGSKLCSLIGLVWLAGLICLFLEVKQASFWLFLLGVVLSAVLTSLGWYQKLASRAGAGTLVPITGFANAVVSPAIEYRVEGLVTGVGAKMFVIAGPVIVWGMLASIVWGVVYYFLRPMLGG